MSSSQHEKMGWTRASLLIDFRPDVKHVILSRIDGKIEMFCFHFNLNHSKILSIASNRIQRVYSGPICQVCSDQS
jgi:hypothetical protein